MCSSESSLLFYQSVKNHAEQYFALTVDEADGAVILVHLEVTFLVNQKGGIRSHLPLKWTDFRRPPLFWDLLKETGVLLNYKSSLKNAFNSIRYVGGSTQTDVGINRALQQVFSLGNGARPYAVKIGYKSQKR
ncbi:hypothetical protein DPMN_171119 [Dreissena polymorpha]|uniref:Uncharacterized protein n=1 Tax=Dreissena polymorpha TaxID=45954 RepID=A0A9D4DZS0_DREPO|nr:hypothetical protein DPMN_171119 [Dreissena polymorpha]